MSKIFYSILFFLATVQTYSQVEIHEGEYMNVLYGPYVIKTDTSMIFYSYGTVGFSSLLAGNLKVTIRAREDYAGNEHAILMLDYPNGWADVIEVNSTHYDNFVLHQDSMKAGNYQLSFMNDSPTERDVHLDYVKIEWIVPDTGKAILRWDPNSEPDLKGYKIYYGYQTGHYSYIQSVLKAVHYKVTGLKFFVPWYFAVTAYDTAGNESEFSQEVSIILYPDTVIYLLGDYNKDGIVDFLDMLRFDESFGYTNEHPRFNLSFDFNSDSFIDFFDMQVFDSNWGKSNSNLKLKLR